MSSMKRKREAILCRERREASTFDYQVYCYSMNCVSRAFLKLIFFLFFNYFNILKFKIFLKNNIKIIILIYL
jgi:hypothetical protein